MTGPAPQHPAAQGCCAPGRGAHPSGSGPLLPLLDAGHRPAQPRSGEFLELPGGDFLRGTEDPDGFPADGEGPVRRCRVEPFAISPYAVTNRRFAEFVEATGFVTEAERFGWSYVFASFLPGRLRKDAPRPEQTPWWCGANGAYWAAPEGPGSHLEGREEHPVVHVSWNDAEAYCRWAGVRLPREDEWEYAARGGLEQARYPWGDEREPGGRFMCNIWRGSFPARNTAEDGYRGTAPVDAFEPNGFGLHNAVGNVWEWTADPWTTTPGGGRVLRGGSYLCHDSYCNRYRVAARTRNSPDSSSGNTGFRVARGSTA